MLLFRFVGSLLLRYEDNKLLESLLFHEPPRNTRDDDVFYRSSRFAPIRRPEQNSKLRSTKASAPER